MASSFANIVFSSLPVDLHFVPQIPLRIMTSSFPSSTHLRRRRLHSPPFLCCRSSRNPPSMAPPFNLQSYRATLISKIEAELDAAIPVRYPETIYSAMRHAVLFLGADRASSVMCVAAACDLLGAPRTAAYPTACALEMAQAASLAHHHLPCMGDAAAPLRRQTTHAAHGVGTAIFAGDALFPHGFNHVLTRTPPDLVPPPAVLRVVAEIARAIGSAGMAAGQFLEVTEEGAIMGAVERKFGVVGECAAACGGIVGGAGEEVIGSLRRYGRAAGLLRKVVDMLAAAEGEERGRSSVVRVHGVGKAMEVAEELRERAEAEVRWLAERYGAERVMPLRSLVEI